MTHRDMSADRGERDPIVLFTFPLDHDDRPFIPSRRPVLRVGLALNPFGNSKPGPRVLLLRSV